MQQEQIENRKKHTNEKGRKMKKENKFILILSIITILVMILSMIIKNKSISSKISIMYETLTKQTNIEEEIKENEILMGITDVFGEGIDISFNDGSDLIHQEDIIILVDELKNAGSQAISVNDVRVTNSTYLYCDGTVILIDGVKIGTPFSIKAIGNAEVIYGAIMRNQGYIETLKKSGIDIQVTKSENIAIGKSNKSSFDNYLKVTNRIDKLYLSDTIVGKREVQGKGLEIVINETKAKLTAVTFLQLINDLNSAGAEAISINGNRVTNMTDMMDISKKYVLINSSLIESPFIIKVIGNPEKLLYRIHEKNSYFTKILDSGNDVQIGEGNIMVEKYVQKTDPNKLDFRYLNSK